MSSRRKIRATLSPEEKAAKALKARRKFKALVRLVMANLFWLGDIDDVLGENVLLNIQKLTRKKIQKSTLTTREKLILTKPKEERTEEEKHILDRAIGGLRCFRRYPPHVKKQLAAVTYFVYIPQDRVIVKQDHLPTALYFLLSGEGLVTITTYDKMLKEWVEAEHGTVGPGTMFGEVALIHGISRTATITTTMPCELLMIKKEDFDIVLKETVWKAWEQITKIMNRFSYFQNWDAVTKRECSIISRTKSYSPGETILGDGMGLSNYSYLVTKGSCCLIEHLLVCPYIVEGRRRYKLYRQNGSGNNDEVCIPGGTKSKGGKQVRPKKTSTSAGERVPEVETCFIQVGELTEGAVFNIGEKLDRRRIVAQTHTSCLMIPRYWLAKINIDNIWGRVRQYLNNNIPSTEKIFKEWLEQKRFSEYGRGLVRDILAKKKCPNTNSIHNVPYSIRLREKRGYDM
ncbi:uncharacterized protein LOC132705551 [Cylas formicarius]|uniref:uncharacterized protein LOC132705551 n=1 Tax=Cylas formicarius TaxID=197179 RepID=UPI0029588B11|nr:uncharacterized protein LOC132705551 [Cylas formicarius]